MAATRGKKCAPSHTMSTQSGITASPELLNAFQSGANDVFIIKVSDDNTQLVEDNSAPKITGELEHIFPKLRQHVESIHPQPVYILFTVGSDEYAFVSFIPDVAHIRDKMLYASTKNTLLQELGGGKIKKDHIFAWSDLEELSYEHFWESRPLSKQDGPLTEEEKYLKDINQLQDLSISNHKLASMDNSSSQLLFQIQNNLENAFAELSLNQLVTFQIDIKNEEIELIKVFDNVELTSLVNTLESVQDVSNLTPQFAVYYYAPGKAALVYTCPSGSKVKDRMIYASNKQGLINHLKSLLSQADLQLSKILDIGDPEELEISELKEVEEQKQSHRSGLKFNKPKGPRRR